MIESIIGICAVLVPFIIWLWRRKIAKAEDPVVQNAKAKEANAKEIITRDTEVINSRLADDLDRLSALPSNKQRPSSNPADERTAIHSKL